MSFPSARFTLATDNNWQTQRVLLFSGHMIDAPDRASPRFPLAKAALVAEAISQTLKKIQAGANDLGITQGASGGDILFAEACIQQQMKLQFLQPFSEAEFLQNSVAPSGKAWLERYQTIRQQLPAPPLAAPTELGPLPANMNPYERCNLWLLHSALAYGAKKLLFICLWDGGGGDGPGGTAHMVAEVKKHQGQVIRLNPSDLGA